MAAHRRADEYEVSFAHWTRAGIHPAAMVLFIAFMLMSLVLKKAFCSWLCPVGTLSEHLWNLGRRVFGRNLRLPKWLDFPVTRTEISSSRFLRLLDWGHVCRGNT